MRELPSIEGLEGSLEVAQIFIENMDNHIEEKSQFIGDFNTLSNVWCKDMKCNDLYEYEKNLKEVGSYMQLTLVDLVQAFPDFSKEKTDDVRELASSLGIVAQIIDDINDYDKGINKSDLYELLKKYETELYTVSKQIGEIHNIKFLRNMYPLLTKITDSKYYKNTRNNLLNYIR
ncbi:MAG: hypothetical protein ABIG84_07500 [archaeon]